jgi:hypothetical protein
MKKNVYISYINAESTNFKFKLTDRFKGRKYKSSEESFDIATTTLDNVDDRLQLAKNISRTDVTVVFITRSVLESKWIPLEVAYSLDLTEHLPKLTQPKGIVGVVIPEKGNDYSYMMKKGKKGIWYADKDKLPTIISSNMFNEKVIQNKYNINYNSYISIYRWEDFVYSFDKIVNAAYDKATNTFEDYNITKK